MDKIALYDTYAKKIGCNVLHEVPMSKYTSFRIGGPAELMIEPNSVQQLANLLNKAKNLEIMTTILGNGSNILVSDQGIRGVVIHIDNGFRTLQVKSETKVICGAGVPLKKLCVFALKNSLTGLEFAYGIPGTAGGAAFMNAGAYGGEMKDVLTLCKHVTPDGIIDCFKEKQLDLSYRHSAYSGSEYVIVELLLSLKKGDPKQIEQKHKELMQKRKEKQPLNFPSAGSVFKRPEGYFAGALIEQCGLKGTSVGEAQVSEKHAGFIINKGHATCTDVLNLINLIQERVFQETGISLEPEIRVVGG